MALTGRAEGPALGAPAALIDLVHSAAAILRRHSRTVEIDGLALLGERAALSGLQRRGQISCGGGCRLVRAADGWVAVALPRPEDVAALPAWLERPVSGDDPWPVVCDAARSAAVADLDQRAALLGLPVAGLGLVGPPADQAFGLPVTAHRVGTVGTAHPLAGARVVDLSSLWAGPLCGQLLSAAGASVLKVESTLRPDGARRGPVVFFDLLNGTKRSVALDLSQSAGQAALARLIAMADVVVESARPRALEQMGIEAATVLGAASGPRVWVSITSHGRGAGARERVAFGDAAAVAGGLVARDASVSGSGDSEPLFLADAVTDPLTGLVAAAAAAEALAAGGRWLLDVAMAPVAAAVAGPLLEVAGLEAAPPRARPPLRPAPALGADTARAWAAL
jgi:crotonobetainyl-CoA:carnitine CoA-transferase CaiB-like acyl-CoA transferase